MDSKDCYESEVLKYIDEQNLTQMVDFNTTSSSCLDLVLFSSNYFVVSVAIDNLLNKMYSSSGKLLSDHEDIKTTVIAMEKNNPDPSKEKFSFAMADYDTLQNLFATDPFSGHCWSNIDVLLDQWCTWLHHKLEQTIPTKSCHRSTLPLWISSTTSHLMKKHRTLRKNHKKPSDANIAKINDLKEKICNASEADQRDYEGKLAEGRSTNILFKYFKSLRSGGSVPPKVIWNSQSAELSTNYAVCSTTFSNHLSHPVNSKLNWSTKLL